MRKILIRGLMILAGILSFAVMGWGVYSTISIDFRPNPVLTFFYCVLPTLSFPVCLLAIVFRKLAVLQAVFALSWLAVYSVMNWRNCSALGLCGSAGATVWMTLTTRVMMAYIGSAACMLAAPRLRAQDILILQE